MVYKERMPLVKLDGYRCERCEHEWLPRDRTSYGKELPTVCPRCKSPYWNRPRQTETAERQKVRRSKARTK